MRILFTGVTSFTGAWFVRALASSGHTVVAAVRGMPTSYSGLRAERLALVGDSCTLEWDQVFGSDAFLGTIQREGPFDVFCHHAAATANYKSPDFDALAAVADNCKALPEVLAKLKAGGCRKVVLTGSVFEAGEGCGTNPLMAFSPYGLSKSLTAQCFRYYAAREGLGLGKFVIPNPFGPYEEPRFTNHLLVCWHEGRVARVNTPDYVRDNIPVSLLALAFVDFVAALPEKGFHRLNPSYFAESQGAFAMRFAREIGTRLGIATPLELAAQTEFPEPIIRINTDRIIVDAARWQEGNAWDDIAAYFRSRLTTTAQ